MGPLLGSITAFPQAQRGRNPGGSALLPLHPASVRRWKAGLRLPAPVRGGLPWSRVLRSIVASLNNRVLETDTAFPSEMRTTFVGSTMPHSRRSTYCLRTASNPILPPLASMCATTTPSNEERRARLLSRAIRICRGRTHRAPTSLLAGSGEWRRLGQLPAPRHANPARLATAQASAISRSSSTTNRQMRTLEAGVPSRV